MGAPDLFWAEFPQGEVRGGLQVPTIGAHGVWKLAGLVRVGEGARGVGSIDKEQFAFPPGWKLVPAGEELKALGSSADKPGLESC